jgi:glycerol-3-phosphate dehydrogenase
MAIAEWVRDRVREGGLDLRETAAAPTSGPDAEHRRCRHAAVRGRRGDRGDPANGEVVCFCERVTRGEIRDALASPLPPCDLDGLRRRTRVLMGICQGFFCAARVGRELPAGIEHGAPA